MRRKAALCLALLLAMTLPLVLASCGARPTLDELTPRLEEIFRDAALLNEIYLGDGIPTEEREGFGEYLFADSAFCEEHGLSSVADLVALTERTYTKEAADVLYRKALVTSLEGLGEYRDRTPGPGLLVLDTREAWYTDTAFDYRTDTLILTDAGRRYAKVSLEVVITPEGKPSVTRTLTLPLSLGEDGVWRADSLTYLKYDVETLCK